MIKQQTPEDHEMEADHLNVPTSHFDFNAIVENILI